MWHVWNPLECFALSNFWSFKLGASLAPLHLTSCWGKGARTESHHFQLKQKSSKCFQDMSSQPWFLDPSFMHHIWKIFIWYMIYAPLSIIFWPLFRGFHLHLFLGPTLGFWTWAPELSQKSKTLSGWASVLSTNSWKPSGTERFHNNRGDRLGYLPLKIMTA